MTTKIEIRYVCPGCGLGAPDTPEPWPVRDPQGDTRCHDCRTRLVTTILTDTQAHLPAE